MAAVGTLIDGKYEILKEIGRGGMSTVYLAMDQHLNKQWAVKEIRRKADERENRVIIQSLVAEANLMKKLDHPALPRIVDILDSRDTIYVIMDYIEGETLESLLAGEGRQPQEQVIEWAKQLCGVLSYLHTRRPAVIYRDVKPGNIMIRPDGSVRLIDFGIAREYKEGAASDTVSLGTKGYAAPEQFQGHGQTDARTDIYSLGVTLYEALTGQKPTEPPYEFYPIRYFDPSFSGGLEEIIAKCVQPDPDDRYQSCAELLYVFNHFEEEDLVYKAARRRKLRSFTAAAAGAVVSLGLGFVFLGLEGRAYSQDFDAIYQRALKESDEDEKTAMLVQCTDLKPSSTLPYDELIAAYKSDMAFDEEEEEQLKQSLYNHLESLQSTDEYADLAFDIGKLYWYYYEYGTGGTGDLTRMKNSMQWFEDAVDYGGDDSVNQDMARVYHDIAEFNTNITMLVEEASDSGQYAPYFENLAELTDMIEENPDEAEIVTLELYKLDVDAIETYARKFKSDGVSEEEMESLLSRAREGAEALDTTTDKTDSLKEEVAARVEDAGEAVARAFTESRIPDSEQEEPQD